MQPILESFPDLAMSPYGVVTGLTLLAAVVFFFIAVKHRALVVAALEGQAPGLAIPEELWTYDDDYIERFVKALQRARVADGRPALDAYCRSLYPWDLAFAVALALFVGLFWFGAATFLDLERYLSPPSLQFLAPYVRRGLLVLASMGILYGVADVAEDIKLVSILRGDPEHIDSGEVAAANALTRIKLVSGLVSVLGAAVFLALLGIDRAIRQLRGGRGTPQPMPGGT